MLPSLPSATASAADGGPCRSTRIGAVPPRSRSPLSRSKKFEGTKKSAGFPENVGPGLQRRMASVPCQVSLGGSVVLPVVMYSDWPSVDGPDIPHSAVPMSGDFQVVIAAAGLLISIPASQP